MSLLGDLVLGGVFVLVMIGLLVVVMHDSRAFQAMDRLIKDDPHQAAAQLAVWREHADHPFRRKEGN